MKIQRNLKQPRELHSNNSRIWMLNSSAWFSEWHQLRLCCGCLALVSSSPRMIQKLKNKSTKTLWLGFSLKLISCPFGSAWNSNSMFTWLNASSTMTMTRSKLLLLVLWSQFLAIWTKLLLINLELSLMG